MSSDNPQFRENGLRPGLSKPIDFVPLNYWNSSPLLGILVNEQWIPLVSGAIKNLLQEEAWNRDDDSQRQLYIESIDEMVSSWRELAELPCYSSLAIGCHFALTSWSGADSIPTIFPGDRSAAWVGGFPALPNYAVYPSPAANFGHMAFFVSGETLNIDIKGYDIDYSLCGPKVYDFQAMNFNGGTISVSTVDCVDFVNSSGAVLTYANMSRIGISSGAGIKEFIIAGDGPIFGYIMYGEPDCVSA